MARTIYFPDGSREDLLLGGSEQELERIIRDRLGDEVAELFLELISPEEEASDDEFACDSYRACLQDAVDELRAALSVLETPRSDRKKVIRSIDKVIKSILSQL